MLRTAAAPLAGPAVAGVAVAAAVWLLAPRSPRLAPELGRSGPGRGAWLLLLLLGPGLVLAGARVTVLAGIAAGVACIGYLLVGRGARRRTAARTAARVRECCDLLAAELSVGMTPAAALARAAAGSPDLAPVERAFALGGDVPSAWREAARSPGAADLRLVGAAWEVAHRTGEGLAGAMSRVAAELRRTEATRRVVVAELASARATARLLAVLPLAALAMGSGAGGNPWAFLFGQPLGWACLATGLTLGAAGLWWIEAIADGVEGRLVPSPGWSRPPPRPPDAAGP